MRVHVEIDLDFARDVKRRRCSFCHRPVTIEDGFLELYSADDGLYYPNGFAPVAVLSHADCGPDTGYAIGLKQLLGDIDGKHGLISHLREKQWSSKTYSEAIREAAMLARALA